MEKVEAEKGQASPEDNSHLTRNRSFKPKQLVRSQAIRESHSPPRTVSPNHRAGGDTVSPREKLSPENRSEDRQSVEIQITAGACDDTRDDRPTRQRCASRTDCANLLSNEPRVACVCVQCAKCRGKRREHSCPIKQDSGIACSDDCPDCTGNDLPVASNSDCLKKSPSVASVIENDHVCACPEKPKNNLSRNDSDDRIDLNGVDLVNFIKATLNKNPKDRMTLLKIEKELHSLVTDTGRCVVRFPVMTSYGRMLVHRCAALFQLSHHVDTATKMQVMVSKIGTSGGRLPCTSFRSWCTTIFPGERRAHDEATQAKSILKRSAHSLDETSGAANAAGRSKSLEQREREYERVRRRIFSSDNCTQDEAQWPWLSGPVKLLTPETGRNKLVKVHSLETATSGNSRREHGAVSKSHSFGSYGGEDAPPPRLLSRQGDLASSSWRLSPSSSGYKTLSLRSTDSVTPSPTGGVSPEPQPAPLAPAEGGALVWAVTDLTSVPAGALIIHPQTGRPLTNTDGSLYHYDPANPPVLYDVQTETCEEEKVDQNNEKRRGRLEKQHSFIDNECDCQPAEECKRSCCCDCQKQNVCCQSARASEKVIEEKPDPKKSTPPSPSKNRNDPPANQMLPTDTTTNQRLPSQPTTNQIASIKPTTVQNEEPANRIQEQYEAKTTQYEQPIVVQSYEASTNQVVAYDPSTNRSPPFEQSTNRSPPFDDRTSRRSPYDVVANVRSQQYYQSNRVITPVTSQEGDKNIVYAVHTPLQHDTVSPPHQSYTLQQNPIQSNEQIARHIPLAVYPQVRYPEYAPVSYQPSEERQATHPESGFRIDPSYPYAGIETYATCPAPCAATCLDPNAMGHRGVSVYAPQMDAQQMYPMASVILPQHYTMPQYQQIQWQPNLPMTPIQQLVPITPKPATPPVYLPEMVYYGYNYPAYPLCPVYPGTVPDRRTDRRTDTPVEEAGVRTVEKKLERSDSAKSESALSRQNSNELALKIQQIKQQMATLSTKECDRDRDRRERARRNNGNGILGSYPANRFQNGVGRPPINDESQLTNAARAIVNSIRNIQGKQQYHHENTRRNQDYHQQNQNHSQNQNREFRTEYRTDRTDQQKNYQRNNSFENRNRYRYQSDDRSEANKTSEQNRARPDTAVCRNRPPINVVRQVTPGNWCRRSPGPPFQPAFRSRHPTPETKPRR